MKEILSAVWRLNYNGVAASAELIEEEIKNCDPLEIEERLLDLEKRGFLHKEGGTYKLTEQGRSQIRIVACGGVFDILHPGHAFILSWARSLGDVLVVIVARDSTVKGRKRIPIIGELQRLEMVSALKPVDLAVLGKEGDPLQIIGEIRPDVIALGPDQHHDEKRIKAALEERGVHVEVRRIKEFKACELNSTKGILQRIIERSYPDSRGG